MPKFALHLRSTNTIEPRHCHSTLKNYVLSRNVQVPDCSSNVLTESRQRVARVAWACPRQTRVSRKTY